MTYRKKLKPWIEGSRPFTTAEVSAIGVPTQILVQLCSEGVIERLARGVYFPCGAEISVNQTLQLLALRCSNGVVCLLTALQFHKLTTQLSHETWIAIRQHKKIPKNLPVAVRVVALTEASYCYGIERHNVDGITLKIYSPAKTVADCFKFRRKIGLDVALEALHDGWRQKRFTMAELTKAAKTCRVFNVMRPYMESLYE